MLRLVLEYPFDRSFAVLLNPTVQQIFFEAPAIAELEGHSANLVFVEIFVECIWRDPKVFGCFAQRHHFLLSFHSLACLSLTTGSCRCLRCFHGSLWPLLPVLWVTSLTAGLS